MKRVKLLCNKLFTFQINNQSSKQKLVNCILLTFEKLDSVLFYFTCTKRSKLLEVFLILCYFICKIF